MTNVTPHTDSCIVEVHEDGSKTVTTVETITPATRAQQAAAATGLGLLVVAPFFPLVALWAHDKFEARREARKAKKNPPKTETD
jgi:hypothetical protein